MYLTASRMVLSKGDVSDHAKGVLMSRLPLVNAGLEGKDWLAGAFSIADIMLFIGLETAHSKPLHRASLPLTRPGPTCGAGTRP